MKTAAVITTINLPSPAVEEYVAWDQQTHGPTGSRLYLVGDEGGPTQAEYDRRGYLGFAEQRHLRFGYARWVPARSYARKNLGYLLAISDGCEVLLDTDDDNVPTATFLEEKPFTVVCSTTLLHTGWVNVYPFFMEPPCWPRGLPLQHAHDVLSLTPDQIFQYPVQQSLVSGEPDVDAVYRLLLRRAPTYHVVDARVGVVGANVCPFNSQATRWFREVFPLLYLPATCTMRCADIWRSLVAQRCMRERAWGVLFTSPQVHQVRNPHDLQRDLEDELPMYHWNLRIWRALDGLKLSGDIPRDMHACYRELVKLGCLEPRETVGLTHWLNDVTAPGRWAP